MRSWNTWCAGLFSLALLFSLTACNDGKSLANGQQPAGNAAGTSSLTLADSSGPGVDLKRTSIGLPLKTLDKIGSQVAGLCGAKGGSRIIFAETEEGETRIYRRDLKTGQRDFLTTAQLLQPGSLDCDTSGDFIVYSRLRRLSEYMDDPLVTVPEYVSTVMRFDINQGQEQEIFNFRKAELQSYRADYHGAMISPDGEKVFLVAYNYDTILLRSWLGQWLAVMADYLERKEEMAADELQRTEEYLHELLSEPMVAKRIVSTGANIAGEGVLGDAENVAMTDLYQASAQPEAVLLVWEAGETRIIPLTIGEDFQYFMHLLAMVGNNEVVLRVDDMPGSPSTTHHFFSVDLTDGTLTNVASFAGAISLLQLDPAGQFLKIIDNEVEADQKVLVAATRMTAYPLDGSGAEPMVLPVDFLGYAGADRDMKYIYGQLVDDNGIYRYETATGALDLLSNQLAEISALFSSGDGQQVVILDQGILYQLDVPEDLATASEWVDETHFADYKQRVEEFFTGLGFTIPDNAIYHWQEQQGLAAHEVAGYILNPARPGAHAYFRYSVEDEQMVSIWFPGGYPFEATKELQPGAIDYAAAVAWGEQVLDRVGWLDTDTRTPFQPNGDLSYVPAANAFVVLFRDGYSLANGDETAWVTSADATVTVSADDGSILELSLSEREPVMDQPLVLTDSQIGVSVRSLGDYAIPPTGPIRIDYENKRLIVTDHRQQVENNEMYALELEPRLCYEVDVYIQPEEALIFTSIVDTENGDVLGQQNYMPDSVLKEYFGS